MSKINDGGRAFPGGNPSRFDGAISDGMTLRDWFAGQALAGWLAKPNTGMDYEAAAARMYKLADAMLAARAAGAHKK
jgi:hypothetical protein